MTTLQATRPGLPTPRGLVRVNRKGKFALRYRFRRAGGYSVKMRVVMLGSPGTPSLQDEGADHHRAAVGSSDRVAAVAHLRIRSGCVDLNQNNL